MNVDLTPKKDEIDWTHVWEALSIVGISIVVIGLVSLFYCADRWVNWTLFYKPAVQAEMAKGSE